MQHPHRRRQSRQKRWSFRLLSAGSHTPPATALVSNVTRTGDLVSGHSLFLLTVTISIKEICSDTTSTANMGDIIG